MRRQRVPGGGGVKAIDVCVREQSRCAALFRNDSLAEDARKGAWMGVCDWLMEEALLRENIGMRNYSDFLRSKIPTSIPSGFSVDRKALSGMLFEWQRDIVQWALRRGKAALFEDCGLGKTFQQLEWAKHVHVRTGQPVLIFAPLAVSRQTQREGEKLGVDVSVCKTQSDVRDGINVTNYEKLHHFIPDGFGGLVLDESSILKGFDGKTRKAITDFASVIPYRLACTATPAPNDYMELGNHAEFLGVMRAVEMLSMFFVHDGGDTSKWRLKGHAEDAFWKWVCSWAVAMRRPSDLGYEDGAFHLPKLHMHQVTVSVDDVPDGYLFPVEGETLQQRNEARRNSIESRVAKCAELVNGSKDPWLVWCNLNAESEALESAIHDSVEVVGSDSPESKESAMDGFTEGLHRVMVTKPTIAGYGMNWQHCAHMAFVGLSDSYEQIYQAVRRCWRFGQAREVHCYVITAETEGAVVRNIERKEKQAIEMMDAMVEHMKTEMQREVRGLMRDTAEYREDVASSDRWRMHLGDCVEKVSAMESESIDFSVFSPPFASLYTYSNSDRDMGNSTDGQFWEHFKFLIPELYRVLKPGRLVSFHCMNLPASKERDGFIGIKDFRGHLIKAFQDAGFIFHSEVCIWKDPVTAMQRTKAIGLLYKQLRKDSTISRQGIPDYLVTMRKPGLNPEPVTKTHDGFPVDRWQQYASPVWEAGSTTGIADVIDPLIYAGLSDSAKVEILRMVLSENARVKLAPYPSPVWMDINPSDTLQRESAREEEDERHICPLQLPVIERAIELWTNPNDLVLSPFAGIGSEGYVALRSGRRFVGVELKESYWQQAVKNLAAAERQQEQFGLFSVDE